MNEEFVKTLAKEFGGEKMVLASESFEEYSNTTWLDTGSYVLNKAINKAGRGLPTGYLVEMFGVSASGKSVTGLHCLESTINQDGIAILIDTEGSFVPDLAVDIGIDLDKLLVMNPTTMKDDEDVPLTTEAIFRNIESILKLTRQQYGRDKLLTIVWDSFGGTNYESDLEKDGPKETQGRPEKNVKRWVRRIRPLVNTSNTLLVIVNQVYSVISPYSARKTKAPGGRSLKFNSQIRIEWIGKEGRAGKVYDNNDVAIGARLHFKIDKNRVGPPWKTGFVEFMFDEKGETKIDYYSGYANYLVDRGFVKVGRGKLIVGEDSYRSKKAQKTFYRCAFMERMMEEHPELLEV